MYLRDLTVACNAKTLCFPWIAHNKPEITSMTCQLESLHLPAFDISNQFCHNSYLKNSDPTYTKTSLKHFSN